MSSALPTVLDFQMHANALISRCSFKLHATARQLHEWTRSEKMKLKEQAVAEMAQQAQGDPCCEEKVLSAEAEVNETFEGEMDNFQTPLVRRCTGSFLRNSLSCNRSIRSAAACFCLHSAQQSCSLGTSPLFHSSKLPLFGGD